VRTGLSGQVSGSSVRNATSSASWIAGAAGMKFPESGERAVVGVERVVHAAREADRDAAITRDRAASAVGAGLIGNDKFGISSAESRWIAGGATERKLMPESLELGIGVSIEDFGLHRFAIWPEGRHDDSRAKLRWVFHELIKPCWLEALVRRHEIEPFHTRRIDAVVVVA
jgi:hypothetical protein